MIKYDQSLCILCTFFVRGRLDVLFFGKLSKSNGPKAATVPAVPLLQGSAVSSCFVEDAVVEK